MSTFAGRIAAASALARALDRDPRELEGEAHEGGEEPVETGDLRQAIGNREWTRGPARPQCGADKRRLGVTCSRCVDAGGGR